MRLTLIQPIKVVFFFSFPLRFSSQKQFLLLSRTLLTDQSSKTIRIMYSVQILKKRGWCSTGMSPSNTSLSFEIYVVQKTSTGFFCPNVLTTIFLSTKVFCKYSVLYTYRKFLIYLVKILFAKITQCIVELLRCFERHP